MPYCPLIKNECPEDKCALYVVYMDGAASCAIADLASSLHILSRKH